MRYELINWVVMQQLLMIMAIGEGFQEIDGSMCDEGRMRMKVRRSHRHRCSLFELHSARVESNMAKIGKMVM